MNNAPTTTQNAQQIERDRIQNYARGWNDAAMKREPRGDGLGYQLGYMDAKR